MQAGPSSDPAEVPIDYSNFLSADFNASDFAQSIINGQPYLAPGSTKEAEHLKEIGLQLEAPRRLHSRNAMSGAGDVSSALAKISFGVDDLNQRLRSEITTHHAALLHQAASVGGLEDNLKQVRSGLRDVEAGVERLRRKIDMPYTQLSTALIRLDRLHRTADLARRTSRFVQLTRRLNAQMDHLEISKSQPVKETRLKSREKGDDLTERVLADAAITLAEIELLLNEVEIQQTQLPNKQLINGDDELQEVDEEEPPISLRAIQAVTAHIPSITQKREKLITEMEMMIEKGLAELNQSLLASSLQTAFTLSVLAPLVASLVSDLTDAIQKRIRLAFDLGALAKDAAGKEGAAPTTSTSFVYRPRLRTEPTNATLPLWTAAFWARMESLVEDMAGCCIKVYTLEKVLSFKKDPVTQTAFIDEAAKALDEKPSVIFWTTLSKAFETYARDAAQGSAFVQQTLTNSYPRLLRLFHDFFSQIAVHTDTIYTNAQQSPETYLMLRSISQFESAYIARSANRMNEAAAVAFSNRNASGAQDVLSRVVTNELDAARFDPLLVKAIANAANTAVSHFRA